MATTDGQGSSSASGEVRARAVALLRHLALPLCGAVLVTAIHLHAAAPREGRDAWSIPVDDTYIHLHYARSIAEGHPFVYHRGDGFSTGCTSPLYALLLAPFFLVGLDGLSLVPVVVVLGGVWLLGSLLLLLRLGRQLGSPVAGQAAAVLWGSWGFTWFCLHGGMETGLYVCLILATASLALDWARQRELRPRALLCLCAAALPLTRPDGLFLLIALLAIAALRALRGPRRPGARGALARAALLLAPSVLYALATVILTGSISTAGMTSKSLLHAPYLTAGEKAQRFLEQLLEALRNFLGGGDPLFLSPLIASVGIAALLALGVRELVRTRGLGGARTLLAAWMLIALAAASMHFIKIAQWTRYYLPCFVLVILGAGLALAWTERALRRRGVALALAVALALTLQGEQATRWVKKFTADALVIHQKQAAAGLAVRRLPRDARVLVCDAGAIPYLSRRWTFDIVGLTTPLRHNAFRNGVGSRFELFESLPPSRRPTHVAAYDFCLWPGARGAPLGLFHDLVVAPLVEPGAGSGEQPGRPLVAGARVVDRLDLADLESEARHRFREDPPGSIADNLLRRGRLPGLPAMIVDGGRRLHGEASFTLAARATGPASLILRTSQEAPVRLEVTSGDLRRVVELSPVPPGAFSETSLELPAGALDASRRVRLRTLSPATCALYHLFVAQR